MIKQSIFLCISNPEASVESFIDIPDGLATYSKAQMKLKFFETEICVKSQLNQIFSYLNQRRCRKEPVLELKDECDKEEE